MQKSGAYGKMAEKVGVGFTYLSRVKPARSTAVTTRAMR